MLEIHKAMHYSNRRKNKVIIQILIVLVNRN